MQENVKSDLFFCNTNSMYCRLTPYLLVLVTQIYLVQIFMVYEECVLYTQLPTLQHVCRWILSETIYVGVFVKVHSIVQKLFIATSNIRFQPRVDETTVDVTYKVDYTVSEIPPLHRHPINDPVVDNGLKSSGIEKFTLKPIRVATKWVKL